MLSRDRPNELLSIGIDIRNRDATDFLAILRQVDDAKVHQRRHGETREISERRLVVERAAENPTRLGEKGKTRVRGFDFGTRGFYGVGAHCPTYHESRRVKRARIFRRYGE